MAKPKEPEFTVTDKRRRYDEDGGSSTQEEAPAPESSTEPAEKPEESGYVDQQFTSDPGSGAAPPPPTQAEQDAQHADYRASNQKLDNLLRERAGSTAPGEGKSFEMTFERLVASLYMTAMMQLGTLVLHKIARITPNAGPFLTRPYVAARPKMMRAAIP